MEFACLNVVCDWSGLSFILQLCYRLVLKLGCGFVEPVWDWSFIGTGLRVLKTVCFKDS